MGRKTSQEIKQIKKDNNCSEIYSWSKYNVMKNETYLYFLKYIIHAPEDRSDSIYGDAGNVVHDLMEGFYDKKLKKEELIDIYDDKMFDLELIGKKFDRNNNEKNEKISGNYNDCNLHFLKNFKPIEGKNIELESFLLSRIKKQLFQGYLDMTHEEVRGGKNKIVITDFKTSSMYKGEKLEKEKGQLLLYAIGKHQQGWAMEDIVIRWLFTKYVHVTVPTASGTNLRIIERNQIGSKLSASVVTQLRKVLRYTKQESLDILNKFLEKKDLKFLPKNIADKFEEIDNDKKGNMKKNFVKKVQKLLETDKLYSLDDIDLMVSQMSVLNSLEDMPQEVQDKFIIEDCFVEVEFDEETLLALENEIFETIIKIARKTMDYNKTQDDMVFYNEITGGNEYFHAVLSGYSPKLHKPYKQLLDDRQKAKEERETKDLIPDNKDSEDMSTEDLLKMLGLE